MQIHWDDLGEIGEAVRDEVEDRLRRLVAQHDDVLSVRIAGKASQHHRHGGREVHISARAKGREIAASRAGVDMTLALHDAVDAFARELRRLRERRSSRSQPRASGPPLLGLVDRVNREEGYGFVLTDDGTSVYFHRNALAGGLSFEKLDVGQRIALNVEAGAEGPQATVIAPAPPGAPSP
jgi:ribosomal subunit interface protein